MVPILICTNVNCVGSAGPRILLSVGCLHYGEMAARTPAVCTDSCNLQVVLAVGRLVRAGFGSPTHRIIYEELPDCTDLLELCEVTSSDVPNLVATPMATDHSAGRAHCTERALSQPSRG
jgi:hypothetical protein